MVTIAGFNEEFLVLLHHCNMPLQVCSQFYVERFVL